LTFDFDPPAGKWSPPTCRNLKVSRAMQYQLDLQWLHQFQLQLFSLVDVFDYCVFLKLFGGMVQ